MNKRLIASALVKLARKLVCGKLSDREVEKHIQNLQKMFPRSFIKPSKDFDGHAGGLWTGFGEDGNANYYRAGWDDELNPKLQKYLDDHKLFAEWNDPGTLMIWQG